MLRITVLLLLVIFAHDVLFNFNDFFVAFVIVPINGMIYSLDQFFKFLIPTRNSSYLNDSYIFSAIL